MTLRRVHHAACRSNGPKETAIFYRDLPGLEFKLAIAEALH